MAQPLYVINSKGEKEPFSFDKVYKSARRVGAPPKLAKKIAYEIKKEVFPRIKTSEIYKKIKKTLSKNLPKSALKFSLKEGMRELGPTGFPFEKYIGEIFKKRGFKVKINQYLPGFCLPSHEIDFLAQKDNLIYIGECKYRNLAGERVHSKEALANYARFLDILKGPRFESKKYQSFKIKTMMVTNTKFTKRAGDYAQCMGVELLGWKYPKNRGLESLIEREGFYPVTILPSLKGKLKNILVSEKIMLAKDVLKIDSQKFAKKFKIPQKQLQSLVREAEILFQ